MQTQRGGAILGFLVLVPGWWSRDRHRRRDRFFCTDYQAIVYGIEAPVEDEDIGWRFFNLLNLEWRRAIRKKRIAICKHHLCSVCWLAGKGYPYSAIFVLRFHPSLWTAHLR